MMMSQAILVKALPLLPQRRRCLDTLRGAGQFRLAFLLGCVASFATACRDGAWCEQFRRRALPALSFFRVFAAAGACVFVVVFACSIASFLLSPLLVTSALGSELWRCSFPRRWQWCFPCPSFSCVQQLGQLFRSGPQHLHPRLQCGLVSPCVAVSCLCCALFARFRSMLINSSRWRTLLRSFCL